MIDNIYAHMISHYDALAYNSQHMNAKFAHGSSSIEGSEYNESKSW